MVSLKTLEVPHVCSDVFKYKMLAVGSVVADFKKGSHLVDAKRMALHNRLSDKGIIFVCFG